MSRQIFGKTPGEGGEGENIPAAPVERRVPKRPLMGLDNLAAPRSESQPRSEGQPVGAFGASLSKLNERGRHAEEIEKKLAAGQTVVELDTALIDPSRPHPDAPGRYQTAFGHRRVRAVAALGIPVRAIVRELSDEEMVVAQGQENHARKDLSFIEKALFARRLESRNFPRTTITAALSVYKSDLSNMLSVAHSIPEALVEAIGPAPGTGRRGWIELAGLLKNAKLIEIARKAAAAPLTQAQDSDERFRLVLAAVKPAPAKSRTEILKGGEGRKIGKVASNAHRLVVTVDRRQAPEFADYLLGRLPELYEEFSRHGTGEADT